MPISVTTAEAAVVLLLVAVLAGLVIVSSRQRMMLRALAAEPGRWRKRLEDLVRLNESTIWSGSPETAYQKTADALAEALDCDEVYIHLLAVTGDHLTECAAAAHGDPAGQQAKDMRLSITTGRMPQMMADHRPIIMDFTNPHPADRIPKLAIELGYKSAASIPLLAGDDMLGIFSVVYKRHQHWTERDIDYLLAIGRLLGVSVQHAQVSQKTVDLQILVERKRLGAEIHDNLSQLISSLKLGAETALLSWEEGDAGAVRRDLERLESISLQTYQTLREEMLSLRTAADQTQGLIPKIGESLSCFEQRWGIGTDLQVQDIPEPLVVSMQTELQLTRILNESLSNVLRHATASHVSVALEADQNRLCMQIHDNGRGFDPRVVPSERLGIRIMRERAGSLGGQLTILSSEENGTTVRVDVPRSAWQ